MRGCHNLTWLTVASVCVGCAATPPPSPDAAIPTTGMIIAARAVWCPDNGTEIMPVLGRTGGQLAPTSTEFIVRTVDGRLISVVQPAEAGLRTGRIVTLHPGQQTHLTANES